MPKRNNFVFIALHIIAWLIFVGLSIEAGGLIVNFIFSVVKPEFVGNLYQKLDLSKMYQQNQWAFFGMYGFLLSVSILKARLFYALIQLLMKLDLSKPFSSYIANKIKSIAYYTFSIGIISLIAREVAESLLHYGYETDKLNQFWEDGQAFILMSAVVYVISQIFKRGVEIQNENDFTV
ncbi:MAG: DUF2975 domain-containing protein [Chitinophagaceae bacterium]|nr:MAG: DUF2975 domain-containing protein [Chitinophagaceae bacterium]